MKHGKVIIVICLLLAVLVGCQARLSKDPAAKLPYEITTATLPYLDTGAVMQCPQIQSETLDAEAVNACIAAEMEGQLEQLLGDGAGYAAVSLDHTVTFANADMLCLLFEGQLSQAEAIHPINVAFPVCVSLADVTIVQPSSLIETNSDFWTSFRAQLAAQGGGERFSETEWAEIVAYVNAYSDAELEHMLSTSDAGVALGEESVIVLLPVPHPVGDYLKVEVPHDWDI